MMLPLIRFYKRWISPQLKPSCRFHPTCSSYAEQALCDHGAVKGGWLTIKRLCRCHPLCEGGYDPVPENNDFTSNKFPHVD